MPTVNKTSLRAELDAIKTEFSQLSSDNKINRESKALFNAMLMLLELMMAVFLEKTTRKTSSNSSLPRSRSGKDGTTKARAKPSRKRTR